MTEHLGHGEVGRHEQLFTKLLELRLSGYDVDKLAALAAGMAGIPDNLSDGPDPEENLFVPAGYTYLGQFIDHDLTFDTTSTLSLDPRDLADPDQRPTNLRSPRFDLDNVYGNGPSDQPYMYWGVDGVSRGIKTYAGVSLLLGGDSASFGGGPISPLNEPWDLERAANGRAIIGDKRNDENSIVNQIQQIFIQFHNKVAQTLVARDASLLNDRGALFTAAQDEVRWAYQRILIDDFLPRIIDHAVLEAFREEHASSGQAAYRLYKDGPQRANLPREFVAAAYRFGHSGVRQGYRLSTITIRSIFNPDPAPGAPPAIDSLVGFEPLLASHVVDDWGRFFPVAVPKPGHRKVSNDGVSTDITVPDPSVPDSDGKFPGDPTVRLQYAYKLDPSLVDPLIDLPSVVASQSEIEPPSLRNGDTGPSLALLNLLRGNRYRIQSGQRFEPIVRSRLDPEKYLRIRQQSKSTPKGGPNLYTFVHIRDLALGKGEAIGDAFTNDTPLWFYILAEAQRPVVDFWFENGQRDLTENQLLGLDENGNPLPPAPDPAALRKQLEATRAAGTQLGAVGGRIVAEVFYGLLDSDRDSLFNRAPGRGDAWEPIWTATLGGGAASMAKLIQFTATPENKLVISAV